VKFNVKGVMVVTLTVHQDVLATVVQVAMGGLVVGEVVIVEGVVVRVIMDVVLVVQAAVTVVVDVRVAKQVVVVATIPVVIAVEKLVQ
jgi:hypothetical protein